jgi:hypothetical protein
VKVANSINKSNLFIEGKPMTIQESLYLRLLQAGVLSERELERYQNLNELSKNRDVVLDRFSFEFSNDITARIDAFLASEPTQPSPDLSNLQAGELAQPSPDLPAIDVQGAATNLQDSIDARRYRFLRETCHIQVCWSDVWQTLPGILVFNGIDLDILIDKELGVR